MQLQNLRILLAENAISEAGITLRSVCAEQGRGLELVFQSNRNNLRGALCHFHPHAAFIAMSLLQPEPYTAISLLHYAAPRVPLILFATTADKECAARCLEAGAHDYMVEGFIDDATVERSLRSAMQQTNKFSFSEISESDLDPLTGLLSRWGLVKYVQGFVQGSPLSDRRLIGTISLKSETTLQRTEGEVAFDRVLNQFGQRLQGCVRRTDVIAHITMGEFVLVIADASESCSASLQRRLESVFRDFNRHNQQDTLQFSIRISSWSPNSVVSIEEVIGSHLAAVEPVPLDLLTTAGGSRGMPAIGSGQ